MLKGMEVKAMGTLTLWHTVSEVMEGCSEDRLKVVDDGAQAPRNPLDHRRSPMVPYVDRHDGIRVSLQNREDPSHQALGQVLAYRRPLLRLYLVEQCGRHVVGEGSHPQIQVQVAQFAIEGPAPKVAKAVCEYWRCHKHLGNVVEQCAAVRAYLAKIPRQETL